MSNAILGTQWTQPSWLDTAQSWITSELQQLDRLIDGPITQPHVTPWATVLHIPTDAGAMYFKAIAPVLAHEVPLTVLLARRQPDRQVAVLATDPERGWLLLEDGGVRLREIIRADHDLGHWQQLLPRYAELQIALADQLLELRATGIPVRDLQQLPRQYEQLLSDTTALGLNRPDGLSEATYERLRDLVPHVGALCQQLAEYGIPTSVDHGDLHDGNVFMRDGYARFLDWGDASLTHPFFSLRTVFVSIELSLGLEEGVEPEVVRDAYLEPWTRYAPRPQLLEAYNLARQLAPVGAALRWHRVVSALDASLQSEYAAPVPSLLAEFLGLQGYGGD